MKNLKEHKWRWIIIGAIVLLVVYGIYANPDRKTQKVNAQLAEIMTDMNSTMLQVKQEITDNKTCFSDDSLKNGGSADCVTNLRNIQETFRTTDQANFSKLENYYQANATSLDSDTKSFIENSLKLYQSDAYKSLMSAYDQYFSAYIDWHKYFRDYVDIKGVDNMTSDEIMRAHTLAQSIVSAEDNLKIKNNEFNDYLQENFDKNFRDALAEYAASLKSN